MSEPLRPAGAMAWIHRATIAAALVCALVYAAWECGNWLHGDGPGAAVRGVAALVFGVVVAWYLRGLGARFAARVTPRR